MEAVTFRQEVAKDLQVPEVRDAVKEFSAAMRRARKELSRSAGRGFLVQQQRHVLEGALVYVWAADRLSVALSRAPLRSAGMRQFGSDLRDLVAAPGFVELSTAAEGVAEALARVRFRMTISAGTVRITPTRDDLDFTEEITAIFARFRREATSSYLRDVSVEGGVNHVQAGIVDQVARLHPEPFATGINKTGVVVGYSFTVGPDTFTYPDGNNGGYVTHYHGFIRSSDGTSFSPYDAPGAIQAGAPHVGTHLFGINSAGDMVGTYTYEKPGRGGPLEPMDAGFLLPFGKKLTRIVDPSRDIPTNSCGWHEPHGINDAGVIVGDSGNGCQAFQEAWLLKKGRFTYLAYQTGTQTGQWTDVSSINNNGVIGGAWGTGDGGVHGFTATTQ